MEIQRKLVNYIQDAHALEQTVDRMLDSMISATEDTEVQEELEHHKEETARHEERLRERLEAYAADPSKVKDYAGIGTAVVKGFADQVRNDKLGKGARDAYVAEQFEIATYELLERLARRAGDQETARVARENRKDEEAMAKKIAKRWDRFLDLSLAREAELTPA